MKNSCINHPPDSYFIKIYDWQIELMGGDRLAAALLSFFEYWHNVKLENQTKAKQFNKVAEMHGDAPTQDTSLYQWHTEAEIEAGIKIGKRTAIAASMKKLVEMGFVSIHRNPNPKYSFDKTRHFLFYPEKVNSAIRRLIDQPNTGHRTASPKSESSSTEYESSSTEIGSSSTEFKAAIPKSSSKKTSKNSENKIKDPPNLPKGGIVACKVEGNSGETTFDVLERLDSELDEPKDLHTSTLAVLEKDDVPPPRENDSQIIKTAEDMKPALTRAKRRKTTLAAEEIGRIAKHSPEAAEAWWTMFRVQAQQTDCKPGSKAEAIAAWDLLHEIDPDPATLYDRIIQGTELYWERESKRDRPNCKHGVRFLEKRDWQEALEWAEVKAQSNGLSAQQFAPFLTCFNQSRPVVWPEADESDLSPKATGRLEELVASCENSIERFEKALLWAKRDRHWGLERSLTFEEFLYCGKINDFYKKQINAEKIGMDKAIAPDRKTIEAAAKKEASRRESLEMCRQWFLRGEMSKAEYRANLLSAGIDPDSVPEAYL